MITATKERPIIFSGEEVRAILDGRKSQFRRVIKPQPKGQIVYLTGDESWLPEEKRSPLSVFSENWGSLGPMTLDPSVKPHPVSGLPCETQKTPCPYGKPGDRLWVRENAYIAPPFFGEPCDANATDNDGRKRVVGWTASMDADSIDCAKAYGVKQTPSIHMPRWASRILLEIVSVRVERLQEISEEDAQVEGLTVPNKYSKVSYAAGFSCLWYETAKPGFKWADSPWVWVVEFKVIEGAR